MSEIRRKVNTEKNNTKKEIREKEVYSQNVKKQLEKQMEKYHSFLTSTFGGDEWLASLSGRFNPNTLIFLSLKHYSRKQQSIE